MVSFPDRLDEAADSITNIETAELAVLLRQAASQLRNLGGIPFDQDIEEILIGMAVEHSMPRKDVVKEIIREALEAMGNLTVETIDEESATEGSA